MTGTPTPPSQTITYEYGIENKPVPNGSTADDGSGSWAGVEIQIEDGFYELNGFIIETRYYYDTITTTTDPDTGDTTETRVRSYPGFTLVDQKLEKTSPDRVVFTTDTGEELFTAEPGTYGTAVSGIVDGTRYDYFRIFDRTELHWLPRMSPNNQEYIINKRIPTDPDPNWDRPRPKANLDTISKFIPDDRESITITYTITNSISGLFGPGLLAPTEMVVTDTITHTVYQPTEDWGAKLKAILNRCYFTRKLYHASLYNDDFPRMYSPEGRQRGASRNEVFDLEGNLVLTESYNQNGDYVGETREPIYPQVGEATTEVRNGEVVSVNVTNSGRYYPQNFYVKFTDVTYTTGGRAPIAIAHVNPIVREEGREVEIINDEGIPVRQFRLGALRGGEINRIEVINGGEGILVEPKINLGSKELSNTVTNYGEEFSYNRSRTPLIPVENRTPDD